MRRRLFSGNSQAVEQGPEETVQSSPLEVFKTQLDKALSNLACFHSWPSLERKVGLETS